MLQLRFRHAAVVCLAATVLSEAGQATSNLDNNPRVVVPDQGNNRVLIYNHPVANGQRADVVLGQSSFSKATFGTSSTTMASPAAYAFDKNGNLYINPVRHLQDRNSLYLPKMGRAGVRQPTYIGQAASKTAHDQCPSASRLAVRLDDLWASLLARHEYVA